MQTITDPIHIILLGGYRVGKTSVLQRLCASQQLFPQGNGLNTAVFSLALKIRLSIEIHLYDFSTDILHMTSMSAALGKILERSEGVLLITEPSNKAAATWTDMALDLVQEYCPADILKFLLVNKADLPWDDHVFGAHHLDQFAQGNDLVHWAYTVAHPQLADIDPSRGSTLHQSSPEDVLNHLILLILKRRQDQFYKLLNLPLQLRYVSQQSLELYEADQLFPNTF